MRRKFKNILISINSFDFYIKDINILVDAKLNNINIKCQENTMFKYYDKYRFAIATNKEISKEYLKLLWMEREVFFFDVYIYEIDVERYALSKYDKTIEELKESLMNKEEISQKIANELLINLDL